MLITNSRSVVRISGVVKVRVRVGIRARVRITVESNYILRGVHTCGSCWSDLWD